jgi:hypothetical protein
MTAADRVLDRMQKVKQTGTGRWLALCPAHEDKSPSLSIREMEDGRILLHAFCGCETESVLNAIGMKFSDLFETRLAHYLPPIRSALNARELIEMVSHEVFVAVLLVCDATNRALTQDESDRLLLASARLGKARAMIDAR